MGAAGEPQYLLFLQRGCTRKAARLCPIAGQEPAGRALELVSSCLDTCNMPFMQVQIMQGPGTPRPGQCSTVTA